MTASTEQCRVTESLAGINVSVDRENGVIRGVKAIGFDAKNGRYYTPEALRSAVGKYDGAKVNIDHPPLNDPSKPRGVGERIGFLKNARFVEGSGIHADFHFNPKHALAEQIAWDAEHQPSAIGFSHNAFVRPGKREGNRTHIAEIVDVKSVDLVADPATTRGVFESVSNEETEDMDLSKVTLEQLRSGRPDLVKVIESEQEQTGKTEALEKELKEAKAELAALKSKEAESAKEAAISNELEGAGFDPTNKHADKRRHISETFLGILKKCESAEDRKTLIDDRAALLPSREGATTAPAFSHHQRPTTVPATEGVTGNIDWGKRLRSAV